MLRRPVAVVVSIFALALVTTGSSATFGASGADRAALATASNLRSNSHAILAGTHCPVLPADNVWNTPITNLAVSASSGMWLASMSASTTFLHPDFGPSGDPRHPYGIPMVVVPRATTFTRIVFLYGAESDRQPYPLTATTPIESGSDRHALMVDPYRSATSAPCTLFETFDTHFRPFGRSTAGSGATWNLRSNALRPAGYTSADAAGLPILPGLVRYPDVVSHILHHALRFTASCTSQMYVWPARHAAGQSSANCPPMGARFRLNASFMLPPSACGALCQTVIQTMKTYGLILADNGSDWYFQGAADRQWTNQEIAQLKSIPASQFVAIDESCLMFSANSGQARQPGTLAYSARCAGSGS